MNQAKKRNIIIGSLCGVLLLMVVGYAAFNSVLNISGTSGISSNWKILITNIETKNIVGGATNAEEPTGIGSLTATFNTNLVSPGDSIEYDITVSNQGSLNAVLEKITVSDSNNPAIKFTTTGLTEGDPLNAGGSAILTIKVEYLNSVTSQPGSTKSELTVTLDYVQEGTALTPTNGVVYRYTTDTLNIGDSIEGIETTKDSSILGSDYYLKHDIEDNKIIASYVCFVTDTEHCMQGGNPDYYETNQSLLHTIFNNSCGGSDSYLYCNNSIGDIFAYSNGAVGVYVGSGIYDCNVNSVGTSSCKF